MEGTPYDNLLRAVIILGLVALLMAVGTYRDYQTLKEQQTERITIVTAKDNQ